MDSLLNKVATVEEEGHELVAQAEKTGQKALVRLRAREDEALAEVRAAAEQRGQKIVHEYTQKAKEQLNKIQEEEKQALEAVTAAAERNRGAAVQAALEMFNNDYLETEHS